MASSHLGSRDAQRTGGELCITADRGRIRAAEGIGGRVKLLPLAWAGMTSMAVTQEFHINPE